MQETNLIEQEQPVGAILSPVPAPAPTMTLCSYGTKLTREELARVATPAATAAHKPIPHIAVVEKLIKALGFRQIERSRLTREGRRRRPVDGESAETSAPIRCKLWAASARGSVEFGRRHRRPVDVRFWAKASRDALARAAWLETATRSGARNSFQYWRRLSQHLDELCSKNLRGSAIMSGRLLIVESRIGSAVPTEFTLPVPCVRTTWNEFSTETLQLAQTQLIVVGASREIPQSVSFLAGLRSSPVAVPVLALLPALDDIELLQSVADGVDDMMFYPLRVDELHFRIRKFIRNRDEGVGRGGRVPAHENVLAQLVGEHPIFLEALNQIERFRCSDAPVLITGETGTGKELFAHAMHSLGKRRDGPFIPVDCTTLPEQIAENELFGHRRGAYTDAHADQKGLAAMAEGGTLFLDEIDALSLANQAKLLRFMQEGSYRALGAERFSRANARVIAATNQPIEDHVRNGRFRADLYFRINVLRLQLTPLRERHGDISLLARYLLENECDGSERGRKTFTPAALRKLESYHWPGNIRELFNVVQRAFLRSDGCQILPTDIEIDSGLTRMESQQERLGTLQNAKRRVIESFERSYVEELLKRHNGNVTRAALEAGKDRRAFGRLAKKYGLQSNGVEFEARMKNLQGGICPTGRVESVPPRDS
jgi:two-component system, NtrC family, response regulator GlrR